MRTRHGQLLCRRQSCDLLIRSESKCAKVCSSHHQRKTSAVLMSVVDVDEKAAET